MGDVSEAMLDGTLCEWCGAYLGPSRGYPVRCKTCKDDDVTPKISKKVTCPVCCKKVKPAGLADHQRDKHGILK
jgi:hypothetical protein